MEKTEYPDSNTIERIDKLPDETDPTKILNLNIGILGHIDSGKTSLAKRLSSIASTASFDKNPQSKERGITLDLGFSAFYLKTPSFLKEKFPVCERLVNSDYLQITLVDCPGHASLIKTVVAGANIIDLMVLVIDIVKGIQVQTTECLILGEILADKMVVALNKIDMIDKTNREKDIEVKISRLRNGFAQTKFGKDIKIQPVAANPKKEETPNAESDSVTLSKNSNENPNDLIEIPQISKTQIDLNVEENLYYEKLLNDLILSIIETIDLSKKGESPKKDFLFSIDHCFNIKNKGTIVTGTILKGKANINDEIYFPALCEKKVIKEMQMFKKPVSKAFQGDRVGMLIKNLDHTKIERSLACNEGFVQNIDGGLFLMKKIKHYKNEVKSNSKMFIIFGNQGVNAKCTFFSLSSTPIENLLLNYNNTISSNNENPNEKKNLKSIDIRNIGVNLKQFYLEEFNFNESLESTDDYQFAVLKFDNKILVAPETVALGSKIDFDISHKANRIAFYGKIIDKYEENQLNKIKIYKNKAKQGKIIRMASDNVAVVINLFKKDSNVEDFIGKPVYILESDKKIVGTIQSKFGQTGKVKIEFADNLKNIKLNDSSGKEIDFNQFTVVMEYKKYVKLKK